MKRAVLRFATCILGLSGFGVLVAEVLKKWQLVSPSLNPLWIVLPFLLVFIGKETTTAAYMRDNTILSAKTLKNIELAVRAILIAVSILILISIPFLWYGTIEETAHKATTRNAETGIR